MSIINLSDWDTSGQLSPYKTGVGGQLGDSAMALVKMLQKQKQAKAQQEQDLALRQAAGKMMGGDQQVPAGVDAGKLYSDLAVNQSKNQTPYANDPLKQMEFENVMKGFRNQTQPSVSDSLGQAVPPQNPGAAVLGAGQETGRPSQFVYAGKVDPKFGTPVQTENPDFLIDQKRREQELKSVVSPIKKEQDLNKAKLAYQNLKYMKDKATNLPSGYGALRTNVGNFFTRGEANPELALYEKEMPAMAVAIYRDITGDTRLSDSDAQVRAYPLLWRPQRGEGKSIKAGSFADLDKLYKARINLIEQGRYKPNPMNPDELITPIEDVIAQAGGLSQSPTQPQGNKVGKYTRIE